MRGLLGDRVTDIRVSRQLLTVDHFADSAALRDYFKARYGPTIAVYRAIADDPDRIASLDRELVELTDRHDRGGGVVDWEYLLVAATKRS